MYFLKVTLYRASTMKRIPNCLIFLGLITTGPVFAGQYDDYEYARVLLIEPIARTQYTQPPYDCRYPPAHQPRAEFERYAPAVVGAVAGGIIGNQLGHKKNRPLTTVLGSVVGASIGSMISAQQQMAPSPASRAQCRPQPGYAPIQNIDIDPGYEITYYLDGRKYVTHTKTAPGSWVKVRRDGSLYENTPYEDAS